MAAIKTPEYIMQMTPAEYKAFVEKGEKPERLKHLLETKTKKEDQA